MGNVIAKIVLFALPAWIKNMGAVGVILFGSLYYVLDPLMFLVPPFVILNFLLIIAGMLLMYLTKMGDIARRDTDTPAKFFGKALLGAIVFRAIVTYLLMVPVLLILWAQFGKYLV